MAEIIAAEIPIPSPQAKLELIMKLLDNEISCSELASLRMYINEEDLSYIIEKIYDLNEVQVIKFATIDRLVSKVDLIKNAQRNSKFYAKIKKGFRNGVNKIILAEGDSWFNYPIILSDVIDWVSMQDNLAVYSLASGGDWLFNMLNARKYVEEFSVVHPDFFVISGGGNDLLGSNRLAAILEPSGRSRELSKSEWSGQLLKNVQLRKVIPLDLKRFNEGVKYLSKDFFALLMFFNLQYYFLIKGILTDGKGNMKLGKFAGTKIITQGYDYAVPNDKIAFGVNPLRWYIPFIRSFLGHGSWLKTPLLLRGITNQSVQSNIIYAMIYLFNEMMIETGEEFSKIPGLEMSVFHIDARGAVGDHGWTDELHPKPEHFKRIAQTFTDCINGLPSVHGKVYVVNECYPRKA